MNKDRVKAWSVVQENDGWYYYTEQGDPIGPFSNEEMADLALDDYAEDYERIE